MTVEQAMSKYINDNATLAAKLGGRTYIGSAPQNPGDIYAVVKLITLPSWKNIFGAIPIGNGRIEVTFWAKKHGDCGSLAITFAMAIGQFNGLLGGSVKAGVFQTHGPRTVFHADSRYHGSQVDVLATIDLSTAA